MPINQTNQRLFQTFVPQPTVVPPVQDSAAPVVQVPVTPPKEPVIPATETVAAAPARTQAPVQTQPPAQGSDDLALLDQILAEAERTAPQAVPTALFQTVDEATQALTPKTGMGGKETIGVAGTKNVIEAAGSTQYVEYEPNPELPPEVEGYLNKTEQHSDQAPPEVVIADTTTALPTDRQLPSQPVVVLPITPEVEKQGMSKPPQFSIRWLVEWSHKIMKMFVGKVIYFQKK